jgi:hypothetical protein
MDDSSLAYERPERRHQRNGKHKHRRSYDEESEDERDNDEVSSYTSLINFNKTLASTALENPRCIRNYWHLLCNAIPEPVWTTIFIDFWSKRNTSNSAVASSSVYGSGR